MYPKLAHIPKLFMIFLIRSMDFRVERVKSKKSPHTMNGDKELFTIGHSNHSSEAFIKLLKQHEVTAIADVRSHPYSRQNPQFTQAALKTALVEAGINYVFLGKELGAVCQVTLVVM